MSKKEYLFDYYKNLYKEYSLKFVGNDIIILMQVGSFYEIYDSGDYSLVNMDTISSILNMVVTKKDKSKKETNEKNHLLIGFPCLALNKYIPKLLENNYTVILVEQFISNGKIHRQVSEIYTKGSYIQENPHTYKSSNWMGFIYTEDSNSVSICFLDFSTGIIKIYEFYSDILENIKRIIKMYSPSEIVVFTVNKDETLLNNQYFEKFLVNSVLHFEIIIDKFSNLKFQNELLSKIYTDIGMLSPVEYCNLEFHPESLKCFIASIHYSHKLNEKIIQFLQKPELILDNQFLYLNSNLLDKLDLYSLEKQLNKCITNIARREFKYRLFNPLFSINKIIERQMLIEQLRDNSDLTVIKDNLKLIKDLELLFRKILLNKDAFIINTWMLKFIFKSLSYILNITCQTEFYKLNKNVIKSTSCIVDLINKFFDFNQEDNECVIKDIYQFNIIKGNKAFNEFYKKLKNCLDISFLSKFGCTIELINEKYHISLPNKKLVKDFLHKSSFSNEGENKLIICNELSLTIKDFDTKSSTKSSIKLYNNSFHIFISSLIANLNLELKKHFNKFYNLLHIDLKKLDIILEYIKDIDISLTILESSKHLKYIKPLFNQQHSFIIKNIRHPIIEYINKNVQYVDNDIELKDGILLYGINSIGKSSLIKSVGISVILAQAGMYVPCSEYNCHLIDKIFTRLPGSDDILSNNSSFTIEISDIRDIILNSTKSSLVLGDEICQSTETYSGISIISATLESLSNKACKFIISSHLHELTELSLIKNLDNLSIKHLNVSKTSNGEIIFDRKLKDGPFHSLYGLEIANNLGLPKDFMSKAMEIRKKLINYSDLSKIKSSKYNAKFYIKDFCQVCGLLQSKTDKPFHIHHIIHQKYADKNGFIGNIHKNDEFNLSTLCESCHQEVHKDNIIIEGYKMTTNGLKLFFKIKGQ